MTSNLAPNPSLRKARCTDDENHGHDDAEPRPARTLYTQGDRDDAVAEGTLRLQDVIDRLTRILVRVFDAEGPAAYGEDGFFLSLTAEGLRLEGGIALRADPRDHRPPHVHVLRPGMKGKLRIDLETGELMDAPPSGADFSAEELRGLQKTVKESSTLKGWWKKNHG